MAGFIAGHHEPSSSLVRPLAEMEALQDGTEVEALVRAESPPAVSCKVLAVEESVGCDHSLPDTRWVLSNRVLHTCPDHLPSY